MIHDNPRILLQQGLNIIRRYSLRPHAKAGPRKGWMACAECDTRAPNHRIGCEIYLWEQEVMEYLGGKNGEIPIIEPEHNVPADYKIPIDWYICGRNRVTNKEFQREIWTFSMNEKINLMDGYIAEQNASHPDNQYWIEFYNNG